MNYIQYSFICNPLKPTTEILIALLADLGFESFVETEEGVEAYLPSNLDSEKSVENLMGEMEGEIAYTRKEIAEENWNATWESDYEPVIVGHQCIVRAPFHLAEGEFKLDIIINPEMSFGTGHHETTWLMLSGLLELDVEGKTVLDMGCGTGVLAIAACILEAKDVLAIDIEERAYSSTLENAEKNNVQFNVKKGDIALIGALCFDLILANINKNVLLQDMKAYAEALNVGGTLLLSGFFESDATDLKEAAINLGLEFSDIKTKNDWTTLRFQKLNSF